jgi:glucans biosynthesis protein
VLRHILLSYSALAQIKFPHEMTLYALLDSESVAGAYSFVVRPGDRTVIDVRARLLLRKPVKERRVAPLTSTFFSARRPEVHDSDGLD